MRKPTLTSRGSKMQCVLDAPEYLARISFSVIPSLPSYRLMPCYLKLRRAPSAIYPASRALPGGYSTFSQPSRSSMYCRSRQSLYALTRNFKTRLLLRLGFKGKRQRVYEEVSFYLRRDKSRDRPDDKALLHVCCFSFVCLYRLDFDF